MSVNSQPGQSLSPIKLALQVIDNLQAKVDAFEYAQREPIAIIGMGCRFPGGGDNPEAFWQLLRDGVDAITEVPNDRWDVEKYYDPNPDVAGKMSTCKGGFLPQVDAFNPEFFGISAREAISMDPQQRLLLEVSWESIENAGQAPEHLHNSSTGVFIGIYINDYSRIIWSQGDPTQIDAFCAMGNSLSVAAGRLSYILGLKGPSMAIDTSCSSSLVAVHLACQSLRLKECNLALAGGVGLNLAPDTSIALSKTRMLNPSGRCQTFDAAANGFVKGEGCGVVVLKRLGDALANRDNILAIIRGSAVNHNGHSSSLIAPNRRSQQAVILQALENSGVEPGEIDYVEVQGTGTSVGEPIEIATLGTVFGKNRPQDKPLVMGSVKTNIGHLEPASGVASLIKVVLALQHREIPPHLHFNQPNPYINWNEIPVKVPTQRMPWKGEKRRLAGVNTFGFSGTNAHVILEEAPVLELVQNSTERPLHLFTLSAKTDEALIQLAERYERHLMTNPDLALGDICFTANSGRSHFQHRLSLVAYSSTQVCEKLATFRAGQEAEGLYTGKVVASPKIAFFFSGVGSQSVEMGRQLYKTQPQFRQAFDRCNEILLSYLELPLLKFLFPEPDTSISLNETVYIQPMLFALEYALFQLWKSWGIEPTAIMGHDIGEYVATCVAGVFSLEDGLKLVAKRGQLMQEAQLQQGMVVVEELEQIAEEVNYSQPQIALVSHHTGELTTTQIATPQYWCDQVQQPVKFATTIDILAPQECDILLVIGAEPNLIERDDNDLSKPEIVWLPTLHSGKENWQQMLETLAALYVRGAKVDWLGFDQNYSRQRVQLPTYPWQRKCYWFGSKNNEHRKTKAAKFLSTTEPESKTEEVLVPQINPKLLTEEDIQAWLVNQIANELGVQPDEINVRLPFDSYGLDSVLAIGIASAGKQFLGLDVSPLLLVHYPTIELLSQYLAKELEASELEIFEV